MFKPSRRTADHFMKIQILLVFKLFINLSRRQNVEDHLNYCRIVIASIMDFRHLSLINRTARRCLKDTNYPAAYLKHVDVLLKAGFHLENSFVSNSPITYWDCYPYISRDHITSWSFPEKLVSENLEYQQDFRNSSFEKLCLSRFKMPLIFPCLIDPENISSLLPYTI